MHYLSIMTDEQTLVMYSGHPMGLFPSSSAAPRVVVTNGMVNIYIDCNLPLHCTVHANFSHICSNLHKRLLFYSSLLYEMHRFRTTLTIKIVIDRRRKSGIQDDRSLN